MKKVHHYIKTVELVLILSQVIYTIQTLLQRQYEADDNGPTTQQRGIFSPPRLWEDLFVEWELMALQLALPAAFLYAGWRTAIAFNEIVHESSGDSSLLSGADATHRSGKRFTTWQTLLAIKAREEGVYLVWYIGGSLALLLLHSLGLVRVPSSDINALIHQNITPYVWTGIQGFNTSGDTWHFIFITVNGYLLYFSLYIYFVRLLCIPFLIVAKAWSDESAFLSVHNSPEAQSSWQSLLAASFTVTLIIGLGWTALFIVPVAALAYYFHIKGQGRHLWLAVSRRFSAVITRGNDEYRWSLVICSAILSFMLAWANLYFDSFSLNVGLILIFAVPLYFLSLSCASAPSQPSSLGKTLVNPAILVFVSAVSGYMIVITTLQDMRFTSIEDYASNFLYGITPVPNALVAQYFFTLTFNLCLFLLGIYWTLLEDRIPGVPTGWRNLISVLMIKGVLLCWNATVPSRATNLRFIGGLSTYTGQMGRFISNVGGFYYIFFFLSLARAWCDRPSEGPVDRTVYRSRFGLFYLHPTLTHVCGFITTLLHPFFPVMGRLPADTFILLLAVVTLGCFISSFLPRPWLATRKNRRIVNKELPSHSLI